ncbi:MAG: threonine synthase [Salinivirgaceae bacterium]|jgi:threonine synthase|nr:threonine synthase [Salinivirgaceae bacterium]
MNFYSIKDKNHKASFTQAMVNGLAPNQALYFPEYIPEFSNDFYENMANMTLPEVAKHVLWPYVEGSFTEAQLEEIVNDVFTFDIPVVKVEEGIYALELFHGPTLAFKDVGARFLAKSMQMLEKSDKIRVLVATSGDTGSAVANGFLGIEGTEVFVLFPKGKVSELQQKQFTTLGQNIKPISIEGTFDDCQRLVKSAFIDETINKDLNLTSANSINVARWIPQSVYYYWAYAQLSKQNKDITVAVPSGNLGNLTSGLLAKKTGLPIKYFIASSNNNRIVPEFLKSGVYTPKPSVSTIANAMDVGDPNNFPRLQEIYGDDYEAIKADISGLSYADEEIREIMRTCYKENKYLLDPHGATGYEASKRCCTKHGDIVVFLETAHPGKFQEEVERTIGEAMVLPERLEAFVKREASFDELSAAYDTFRTYLLEHK